jgi:predicted lipoprotein with Yx(FWY)xxD motif
MRKILFGTARDVSGQRRLGAIVFAALLLVALAGTRAAAATPTPTRAAAGAATVMTKTGPDGTYLVDGTGKSLYLFVIDTNGKSMCSGACAQAWPPLITTGQPTAGPGVTASKLTTITRSDGSTQVAYAGHPLYYFEGDTSAGMTTGQGINNFGGLWWLVSPAGTAIQK